MIDPDRLREWLSVPAAHLPNRSRIPIRVVPTPADVHRACAEEMFAEMSDARDRAESIAIIVPLGPTGQYPVLADMINDASLSLDHVTFVGMDQWLDWHGRLLPASHSCNFLGEFRRRFVDRLSPGLQPPEAQILFPDPSDLGRPARVLAECGGARTTYGGFGFQGHIAFNEPPATRWTAVTLDEFRRSTTRILSVTVDTIIAHAQRSFGGNVTAVPPMAATLGMRELLGAGRIRLYTDGGAWKQTILRILLFAEPTVDYPVTLVRDHPDVAVVVDEASAEAPRLS
jgi:glucosamine-6-phosphate deaminase